VAGQLFVRPVEKDKPISIFLTSDSGATYALTLQPADIPAESLIIKENKTRTTRPTAAERAASRQAMIKTLLIETASGRIPDDMEVRETGDDVLLWRGTKFTHDRDWLGMTIAVGHYRLMNTSQEDMRLAEQEFFRPDVIAVAIERHVLRPGESTRVFIVRHREGEL
jgi:conjugal transfer pilus assembly protein TraK